ncbi:NADPH:quinone oxidoreductase family protein [Nocardioides montaniterrae]
MRAVRVNATSGPSADTVVVSDVEAPEPADHEVLIRVEACGVSFPDLLMTKGEYQFKPPIPYTPGVDGAGVVVSGGSLAPGTRVCAVSVGGFAAEYAVAPADWVFPLPSSLSFEEGAAMPMNYMTALFVLAERAGLVAGETVLVNGASGGVGTATLQVARALGARTIAVVSSASKAEFARSVGADEVVLLDGFRDAVKELTGGRGVDVLVDVVGGDIFTDSLRCLAKQGRLMVVGFAASTGIPEVKVNRLLLNNTDVRGAAWGEHAFSHPGYMQQQWKQLVPMIESGVVKPPIGRTFGLAGFVDALAEMDSRGTLGKSVVLPGE